MPPVRQRISINLPNEEYVTLSAPAEKNNLSSAWNGRRAIPDFPDRYRDRQIPLSFARNVCTGGR